MSSKTVFFVPSLRYFLPFFSVPTAIARLILHLLASKHGTDIN